MDSIEPAILADEPGLLDQIFSFFRALPLAVQVLVAVLLAVALAGLLLLKPLGEFLKSRSEAAANRQAEDVREELDEAREELRHTTDRHEAQIEELKVLVEELEEDARVKTHVLKGMRQQCVAAVQLIDEGRPGDRTLRWVENVLKDVVASIWRSRAVSHRASVWKSDGQELVLYAGFGFPDVLIGSRRLPMRSAAGDAMKLQRGLLIADVSEYTGNFAPPDEIDAPFTSLLVVPVFDPLQKAVCAVLCVDATSTDYFDEDARFFVECFADVIGAVLDGA